jgi:hypothetical protein
MQHKPKQPVQGDSRKPVRGEGWFATFTFLDVSGAFHSRQVRRLGAAIAKAWKMMLRAVSDRSKSRVMGA